MFKSSFEDILYRVKVGIDRDDLKDLYISYINQAIREIENRCSFNYMKKSENVQISNGELSTSMPVDYKEIIRLKSPVSRIVTPSGSSTSTLVPCVLYSRQALERLQNSVGSAIVTSGQDQQLSLLLDIDDNTWFLSLLQEATEDINLRVNYYGYSEKVTEEDPEHPLFTTYPTLVVACAKYIIFSDINDDLQTKAEEQYERELKKAKGNDRSIAFSGFDSHM